MDAPKRKPTRLKNFDYSTAGYYFVTLCTKERKKILSNIVGDGAHDVPIVKLTPVGQIVEKYIISSNRIKGITIDKYVIMPDHIHILICVLNMCAKQRDVEGAVPYERYDTTYRIHVKKICS